MASETFWAWLAGFFDGEGHLIPTKGNGAMWGLTQSGERGQAVLSWVKEMLSVEFNSPNGIRLCGRVRKLRFKTQMPTWELVLERRELIAKVLERTLPYLRVKKSLAQDTIRYWKLFPPRNKIYKSLRRSCIRGHPYAGENVAWNRASDGTRRWRRCRTCAHEQYLRRKVR